MSRFFTEVEFELPEDPGAPVKKTVKASFDPEKLKLAITEIRAEFDRIRQGTSKLTTYPIADERNSPANNGLIILQNDPTEVNYKAFLELSRQDLGQRAAIYFMALLKDAQNA